jgi:hypothetical protein
VDYNIGLLQSEMGDHVGALESLRQSLDVRERLAQARPGDRSLVIEVARSHILIAREFSRMAGAVTDVAKLKGLADDAMAALGRADVVGWTDWKVLDEEEGFKPLRDRPDFQAFLRERMRPKAAAKE